MRQYGQTTPSPTFTKEAPHFLSAGNAASRSRCHNGWVRHPLRVGKTPSVGGENENSWGCPLESKMPPHDEIQVKNRYYTDCTSHLDIVSHTDKNRFFECTVRHLWQKLVAFGNSLKSLFGLLERPLLLLFFKVFIYDSTSSVLVGSR